MDRDAWQKLAEESADRAEAAGAFVADRLGADYHDDYFATAKLTLWVYKQSQEIDALRAERDAALRGQARLREAGEEVFRCTGCGVWWDSGWPNNEGECPECGTPFPQDAKPTHMLVPIAAPTPTDE